MEYRGASGEVGLLGELVVFQEFLVRTGKEFSQRKILQMNIRQISATCQAEFSE